MKEKGIKVLVSIFLFASILMPFIISADTITSANIIGVNKVLINSNYIESVTRGNTTYNRFTFTYEYEVLLDDYYLGYINGSLQQSYRDYDVSMSTPTTENRSLTKPNTSYYVNGNSFKTSSSITAWCYVISGSSQVDPTNIYNPVFTLNTSNIHKYQDIDSIDTVIDILNDVYQYVSIDQYSELQSIVSNTSLSNQYLETISLLRQYNIPFESYTFVYSLFRYGHELYDIRNNSYFQYPIFKLKPNSYILYTTFGTLTNTNYIKLIFYCNEYLYRGNFLQFYNIDTSNFEISKFSSLGAFSMINSAQFFLYDVEIKLKSSATNPNFYMSFGSSSNDMFIPIYFCYPNINAYGKVSTEFALQWGLSNELLDNLGIIAQGTQQSQQAGSDLDDATSDMQSDFNSYYSIENTANSDFNSALNGINFNDQIAGNQSFLDSASFVKTVFSSMMQIPILSTFVIILCIILMARIFL